MSRIWLVLGLLSLALPARLARCVESGDSDAVLTPQKTIERSLGRGETHTYRVAVKIGQFVHLVVRKKGIDLRVTLSGPDGTELGEANSPNRAFGPEPLSFVAMADGVYEVKLTGSVPVVPNPQYEVTLQQLRSATEIDLKRGAAQQAFFRAGALQAQAKTGSLEESLPLYEEAMRLWHEAEDPAGEARALFALATTRCNLGSLDDCVASLQNTLGLVAGLRDPGFEATVLTDLGYYVDNLGEHEKALSYNDRSLAIAGPLGDLGLEAEILQTRGLQQYSVDDRQAALSSYSRSLSIARKLDIQEGIADNLLAIAQIYEDLGESDRALALDSEALDLHRARGDRRSEASTLHAIGWVFLERAEWSRAIEFLRPALQVSHEFGDRREEAKTLNALGRAHLGLEAIDQAVAEFSQALEIRRAIGDRQAQGRSLKDLGDCRLKAGRAAEAIEVYKKALELRQGLTFQAETFAAMARALSMQGQLVEARERAAAAIAAIESLSVRIATPQRGSYLGSNREYYDLEIELLMRLHRENPGQRLDLLAFQVSERARARGMMDLLVEARADIRQGVKTALLEQERKLSWRLRAKLEEQTRLLSGKHTDELAARLSREVDGVTTELEQLDSEIRSSSPRYAALTRPEPIDAQAVQRLLDEDTLLLEYFCGEEQSFLWVIRSDGITSFALPGRSPLEAAAKHAALELSTRPTGGSQPSKSVRSDLAQLSNMLLGPAAGLLDKKRIAVVADGALLYVPFAALPLPGREGAGGPGLVTEHEIVTLPSASTLAILRQQLGDRPPAPGTLAVLADPVFQRGDTRVQVPGSARREVAAASRASPEGMGSLDRSIRDVAEGQGLDRLPFTRGEARTILKLVPASMRKEALDFDANRALATSEELSKYRFVHFATHGLLDAVHPELSGLVLSLVDRQGRDQDGFLPASEVFNLKLSADLVVLSACRTALGKEIRGEGLVGLTRAFMYAGAPRVVASLWRVDDAATAELMKRFYQGMLGPKKLRPAAALREAQLAVRRQKRWEHPYYWAGFVLQGEWR